MSVQPGITPDLLYSQVEDDLRAAVRGVLSDRCPTEAVLTLVEGDSPYDPALWRALAQDLGVAGLLVPEELGGQGASAREAAVVLEEIGSASAPTPFLGSAVLASSVLLACDTTDTSVAAVLNRIASGGAVAALTVPLTLAPGSLFPPGVTAEEDGTLRGRATSVGDALNAEVLLVPATGPQGPGLYEIAAGAPGVTVEAVVSLDLTRPIADCVFDGAAAHRLKVADAAAAVDHALLTGAGLLASEQVGIAQWCLDETVRYLKDRHQFGRPVGSFQSLKHRLAEVWLEILSARAAARNAADALASGSTDAAVAVAVAQAYCSTAAVRAAEECVQLHGGIGMTWEHPAHLRLKRAKADELALGTPGRHRTALAGLVGLPPAE